MIITDEKILRQISQEFKGSIDYLSELVHKLEYELEVYKNGVGLSAIQVGIPIKVCIIRTENLHTNLWNTEIIDKQDLFTFPKEGCLSIPNTFGPTLRYNKITIKNGDGAIGTVKGFEAVVIQHELDHWNGILFTDKLINTEKGEI